MSQPTLPRRQAGFRYHRAPIPTSNVLFWLAVAAMVASLVCGDMLAGLAIFALGAVFLMLRDSGDPGILMFCLFYQWLFIVTGFVYRDLAGAYPGGGIVGSLSTAVSLLLLALVSLAVGLRAGMRGCDRLSRRGLVRQLRKPEVYDVNKLFWLVIFLFGASWLLNKSPRDFAYSISQILLAALAFRFVFLYTLFLMVVRQGRGYGRAGGALLFALTPTFLSGMSQFKDILFMVLLAVITEILQRARTVGLSRKVKRLCVGAACLATMLAPLGLIWNGAIKPAWRPQVQGIQPIEGSTFSILRVFFSTSVSAVTDMDWSASVEGLAERFSSSPHLFSLVIDRVPGLIPYENGALTSRGVRHILMPRFLFPEKMNLGSDSWLVRKYAGVAAAGEEANTSIGLGYLAEFYIDFGPVGMPITAFCLGGALGFAYRAMALAAPSLAFYTGSMATVMIGNFIGLESNFAKMLGGLVMSFVVFALLLKAFGPRLHLVLLDTSRRHRGSPVRR